MFFSYLFHHIHQQSILIHRQVGFFKDRSKLILIRSNLIMPCFDRNSQEHTLLFEFSHITKNTAGNSSKVMILHLLPFSSLMSQKGTTCDGKVRTCPSQRGVYQKIFQLPTKSNHYFFYIFIKILGYSRSGLIYCGKCLE